MASSLFPRLTFISGRIMTRLLVSGQFDTYHRRNPGMTFTNRQVQSRFFGSDVLHLKANEKTNVNDLSDDVLFDEGYTRVTSFLTNTTKSLATPEVSQWMEKVLNYNVPHGKKERGRAVLKTFNLVFPESTLEEKRLAVLLGWCIELCQAYFLVMDDIMDQSVTRRGMPCWFRQKNVGLNAVNDAILLECGIYQIVKGHFLHHPSYSDIVHTFNQTIYLTSMGQCLDMLSTPVGAALNLDKFTPDRYLNICRLKTCYYTFCLPVQLALLLAEKGDLYTKDVENLLLTVGHYFQVQDDFLDCFGDPVLTGKQGTDIESGKCSWTIMTALQLVGTEDKLLLEEHYGRTDPESVKVVKDVYQKVGIPNCFEAYENETYISICKQIEVLGHKSDSLAQVCNYLLKKVHRRRK